MADDKDKYVAGRGNPSLDPTRTDLQAKRDALFKSAFSRDNNGLLTETSRLAATNAANDARRSKFGTPESVKSSLDLNSNLSAGSKANMSKFGTAESAKSSLDLDSNLSAAGRAARVSLNDFGSKESMERSWGPSAIPKTERANTQRDTSGGGAKSGIRPSKKLSSFGRNAPFDDYGPSVIKSPFFKGVVKSAKHFVPQFGLYGTGYHGGPARIQPMKWEGAFPVMDIQQMDSSTSTTFTQDEDND
jgi:hypothetical protein